MAVGSASEERLDELTAREREVLVYTGRGLFNAETAAELVISENTARVHVLRILAKLQLRDQAQAVVRAHRLGLAPASEWASALGDLTSWKVNA